MRNFLYACTTTILTVIVVHSGCAISGLLWLIVFTVQATKELLQKGKVSIYGIIGYTVVITLGHQTSIATVAVTYFILVLLIGIVLFAYPKNRSVHHDAFERSHRFLGWSATALVWCQVSLRYFYESPGIDKQHRRSCSPTITSSLGKLSDRLLLDRHLCGSS